MTLKINYLDKKKSSINNKAVFIPLDAKIAAFNANFDRSINQKILNFLKKNKNTKENKIISLNHDFDQKLIIILLVKNNNQLESEKLGAKFFGFVKSNEIYDIFIDGPNFFQSKKSNINFDSFLINFSKPFLLGP